MSSCDLTFSEMMKSLNAKPINDAKSLNITILRNIILEPIEVPIKYFASQSSFQAKITFGELDNVFQDSLDEQKIRPDTDVVLIVSPLYALNEKLMNSFCSLSQKDLAKEQQFIKNLVFNTLSNIRNLNDSCLVFWLGFEQPAIPAFGINDHNMLQGQTQFISALNKQIDDALSQFNNCILLNNESIIRQLGTTHFYDWRYWYLNRSLYSREALMKIAKLMQGYINAMKGNTKKCLILDCDNTLWGGVVGEEGVANIQLSTSYPGSCYQSFQKAIVELYKQGVIIALCSKNNEEDVIDIFENHPNMVLKKEHISTYQINWQDKASNIVQIARDLNIGLDSLVFIDDSEFEIELVEQQLPLVKTILLDKARPVEYADILKELNIFDKMSVTQEDALRGKLYKEQAQREDLKKELNSIDEYLRSLKMHLTFSIATKENLSRIAQLTQKTNQFNLTTKRYSEDDIQLFLESNDHYVIVLEVKDRFGYMGEVGVLIIELQDDVATIDSYLLSCRVLGRTIEFAFLKEVLNSLSKLGIERVNASYFPTKKNIQTKNFYKNLGFKVVLASELKTDYSLPLLQLTTNDDKDLFVIENLWFNQNKYEVK
jgi:FkbH-like protein